MSFGVGGETARIEPRATESVRTRVERLCEAEEAESFIYNVKYQPVLLSLRH